MLNTDKDSEKIEKLKSKSKDDQIKLLYTWTKTDVVSLKEFSKIFNWINEN